MKRIKVIAFVFVLLLELMSFTQTAKAASGSVKVSGGGTYEVGETVKIKVSVNADETLYGIDLGISYNPDVLQYQSGADTNSGGMARIARAANGSSFSYTITLKAIHAGSSKVSVTEAIGASTTEFKLSGDSTSVSVKAPVTYSSDSSLKSLTVSPGKLSPSFSSGTKNYSVTVGNETNKLSVSAVPKDNKAEVTSVSGNNKLSVGKNTVKIIVTAEDGSKSTHTIVVTREAAKENNTNTKNNNNSNNNNTNNPSNNNKDTTNTDRLTPTPEPTPTMMPEEVVEEVTAIEVQLGSEIRYLQKDFEEDDLPKSFEKRTATYKGEEVAAAVSKKGELTMFYLSDLDKKNGAFYVYTEQEDTFSKYLSIEGKGGRYVIFNPESNTEVPTGFETITAMLDKRETNAWKKTGVENNEFYLVYAMSPSGNKGWYLYDTVEETFQRYPTEIIESESKEASYAFSQDSGKTHQKLNDLQAKYNKVWNISLTTIIALCTISAGLLAYVIYLIYRHKYKKVN